jgi:hypothetical protein
VIETLTGWVARMRWNMNRGVERVAEAVGRLFRAASGRSILSQPLQRRFRDFQAAIGHAFLAPDPLARTVGCQLLGAAKPEMVLQAKRTTL